MLNLVNKSLLINIDDQEYNKMKQKIVLINNKSLTDEIFYEQRLNVRKKFSSIFILSCFMILDM
jgi:hypothetical protein